MEGVELFLPDYATKSNQIKIFINVPVTQCILVKMCKLAVLNKLRSQGLRKGVLEATCHNYYCFVLYIPKYLVSLCQ